MSPTLKSLTKIKIPEAYYLVIEGTFLYLDFWMINPWYFIPVDLSFRCIQKCVYYFRIDLQ